MNKETSVRNMILKKKKSGYSLTNNLFIGFFTGEKKNKTHHFSQELMLTNSSPVQEKEEMRVRRRIK